MRILTKFDLRNNNVVKGIQYEGVEVIGSYDNIYHNICSYIKENINSNFEIILNDVTASLYNINSGENDIKNILKNKNMHLPHICSGGIKEIHDINNKLNFGCDRIMINTALFNDSLFANNAIKLHGAQLLIASVETRYVNGDYYVYKSYGRDDTGIKLIEWINKLHEIGIIEILLISMDKDGTLNGYDNFLLEHIKKSKVIDEKHISLLYAGGISNINEIKEIEDKYPFITGVSISTLFYKNIANTNLPSSIEKPKVISNQNIYFLSYLHGNKNSVIDFYSKKQTCIIIDNIKDIPDNGYICISGHYNTFKILELLQKNNDFDILKERLVSNNIKYIGICAGLQLLTDIIYDEFSDKSINGLNIIKNTKLIKLENPNIGFIDGKFFCHSYYLLDNNKNVVNEYKNKTIEAYQYHPENSGLII